jgi:hypothetical protein
VQQKKQIQEVKNKERNLLEETIESRDKQTPLSELFRQSALTNLDLERDKSPVRPGPEL